MSVGVQQVQIPQTIATGEGFIMGGSIEKDLQDLGSLEGNVVLTLVRDQLPIMDGNPAVDIGALTIQERATLAFVLKEQFLENILMILGYTTAKQTKTLVTSTVARTNEQKVLWGTEWAHLLGKPVLVAPAVVADDGGATPVVYSLSIDNGLTGDFLVDYTEGTVRRTAVSTVPNGGRVYFDYSYTEQKHRLFSFGGDMETRPYFYFRMIHTRADGYRQIISIPKATFANPSVLNFNKGGFNTKEVVLQIIADTSLNPGDKYLSIKHEYSSGA